MSVSPFGKLPLDTTLFLSRVSKFMTDGKKYVASAFKPGFGLQAAELNEIQEQFFVYQTLSNRCINTWIDSGLTTPNPFWNGATPFSPGLLTTVTSTSAMTVTAGVGWYYLVDSITPTDGSTNNSGFGYWIHNSSALSISVALSEVTSSTTATKFGFTYSKLTVDSTVDTSLLDNSNSSNAQMNIPGADRISIRNLSLTKNSSSLTQFSELFGCLKLSTNSFTANWPYRNYAQIFATVTG